MRFTNSLIAVLVIAGVSAAIVPAGDAQNPTFVADIAAKMHQKYFIKEQTYRFNVTSKSMSEAAVAVVSFNKPEFTTATGQHQLHVIGPRDIASVAATAVTDPDDWRYFHYEGIRTGNDHWWRGGGSKVYEIKAAHDQVVTPTLPKGIKIPKPFLPTDNTQVLALYTLAIDQYHAEEKKGRSEKIDDLAEKRKDMRKFSQMNQCVHDKNFCTQLKFREALWLSPFYKKNKKEYNVCPCVPKRTP